MIVVTDRAGHHVMFIAPITSKAPDPERTALELPADRGPARRLWTTICGFWVILDELNTDILEASYTPPECKQFS